MNIVERLDKYGTDIYQKYIEGVNFGIPLKIDVENYTKSRNYSKLGFLSIFIHKTIGLRVKWYLSKFTCKVNDGEFVFAIFHGSEKDIEYDYFYDSRICTYGSLESQDGEYRNNYNKLQNMIGIYDMYKIKLFEDHIRKLIDSGELKLENTWYTKDQPIVDWFDDVIEQRDVIFKVFVFSIFAFYNKNKVSVYENHINPLYRKTFLSLINDRLYEESLKVDPVLTDTTDDLAFTQKFPLGQKLYPLNQFEDENEMKISLPVWKEIYIGSQTNLLTMNYICSNIPISIGWFKTQAGESIFENNASHEKYGFNNKVKRYQFDKEKVKSYLEKYNAKRPLDNKLTDFTKLATSKNILCVVMEHMGRTVYDLPRLIKHSVYRGLYTDIFSSFNRYKKFIFDFAYTLMALNTKLLIIHGDLHLNNVTITYSSKEGTALFKIDKYYAFPTTPMTGTIIDFSRAIMGDMSKLRKDFGDNETKAYEEYQYVMIDDLLKLLMPKIHKLHGETLKKFYRSHQILIFKIFTILDIYMLLKNIRLLLSMYGDIFGQFDIIGKVNDFMNGAIKWSRKLFKGLIEKVITDAEFHHSDFEWPMKQFINVFFADNVMAEKDVKLCDNIIDLFNYNNPLKYEWENTENWPPSMNDGIYSKISSMLGNV